MRSNAADILLWIIHHVLRLLARLLWMVGALGLWRGAIRIEGCRRVSRAISIRRCIHGSERLRWGQSHGCSAVLGRTCD
jgi:hypothetical protein